jgi:hypothetical protein
MAIPQRTKVYATAVAVGQRKGNGFIIILASDG